jgi:hypothetical protein
MPQSQQLDLALELIATTGEQGVAPRRTRDRRIEEPCRHPADPQQSMLQSRTREMEPLTTTTTGYSNATATAPHPGPPAPAAPPDHYDMIITSPTNCSVNRVRRTRS